MLMILQVKDFNNTGSGSSGISYNDFRKACNEEILIAMQGQTLTTVAGDKGARSLGQVHQDISGKFLFPKQAEPLEVSEIVQLSDIIDIPQSWLYDKYGIPIPKGDEKVAKANQNKPTIEQSTSEKKEKKKGKKKKPKKPTTTPSTTNKEKEAIKNSEKSILKKLYDFFVKAPQDGANLLTRLTDSITANKKYGIDLNKLFLEAVKEIYANQGSELVNKKLFQISNTALQNGIRITFDEAGGAEWGKENKDFIDEFKVNTAVFSAFKNHQQTKEIAALLTDEDGNIRSFRNFKKEALKLSKNYDERWLQTEYNTAIKSARAAVNYRKWLKEAHLYPNLEYIESSSVQKRETHYHYAGTILPIRHEWWDTHLPPSDWNCNCSVRPTDKEPTAVPSEELINPVFANNPGKTAEFVSISETAYYKNTKKKDREAVKKFAEKEAKLQTIEALFTKIKEYKNGGKVLLHPQVDRKGSDFKKIMNTAKEFAKEGNTVKITPRLHFKSEEYDLIYYMLKATSYYRKCPDLIVNEVAYEFENFKPPFNKGKISNMISHGTKQSSRIIINNDKGCKHSYIIRNIYQRLTSANFKREINGVWVYEKGKVKLIYNKTKKE